MELLCLVVWHLYRVQVSVEGCGPGLQLVHDGPGRRHGDWEQHDSVLHRLSVNSKLEQLGVPGVTVQHPYAQPSVLCGVDT